MGNVRLWPISWVFAFTGTIFSLVTFPKSLFAVKLFFGAKLGAQPLRRMYTLHLKFTFILKNLLIYCTYIKSCKVPWHKFAWHGEDLKEIGPCICKCPMRRFLPFMLYDIISKCNAISEMYFSQHICFMEA